MHKGMVLILILLVSCTSTTVDKKETSARDTGRCREYEVPEGSECYLTGVRAVTCGDCGTREKLYVIAYNVGKASHPWGFELSRIRIPAVRAEEFETLVSRYQSVKCTGVIVLPPCGPEAKEIYVKIPWPDWARFQR